MAKNHTANTSKMKRKANEREQRNLQVELCHLQEWVKAKGLRAIVVLEGRGAPPARVVQLKRSPNA
jgi:polyphosphate kinase 2 (PPK2 family)